MTRFFKPALLGTSALLLTAGLALASPKADTNNDGTITKAEFVTAANLKFMNSDTNADGVLTMDEKKAARQARRDSHAAEKFNRLDLNGDGVVSEAEYNAKRAERAEKKRERMDVNKDGTVDQADRDAMKAKRAERRAERGGRKDRGQRKERIRADANEDGVVTRAEFDAATEAMFTRMDANNDGVLTEGEGRKRRYKKRGFWKR